MLQQTSGKLSQFVDEDTYKFLGSESENKTRVIGKPTKFIATKYLRSSIRDLAIGLYCNISTNSCFLISTSFALFRQFTRWLHGNKSQK